MRSLEQGFCFPGLVFRQDLLLPAAPPSVHPESACLALLPKNQPSSCAAKGGDWQVHVGSFLSPSLPELKGVGVGGVQRAACGHIPSTSVQAAGSQRSSWDQGGQFIGIQSSQGSSVG